MASYSNGMFSFVILAWPSSSYEERASIVIGRGKMREDERMGRV